MVKIINDEWAMEISNKDFSEAVQRIAFSFGYHWNYTNGNKPDCLSAKYLCFDASAKDITWSSDKDWLTSQNVPIYTTIEEMMNLFQNPPTKELCWDKDCVKVSANGTTTFNPTIKRSFTPAEFDEFVAERAKFLSK